MGNFLSLLGITLIFAADLHHLAIAGIARSYQVLPPDGVPAFGDALMLAVRPFARGFTLAVQISGRSSPSASCSISGSVCSRG